MTIWIVALMIIAIGRIALTVRFWKSFDNGQQVHAIYREKPESAKRETPVAQESRLANRVGERRERCG